MDSSQKPLPRRIAMSPPSCDPTRVNQCLMVVIYGCLMMLGSISTAPVQSCPSTWVKSRANKSTNTAWQSTNWLSRTPNFHWPVGGAGLALTHLDRVFDVWQFLHVSCCVEFLVLHSFLQALPQTFAAGHPKKTRVAEVLKRGCPPSPRLSNDVHMMSIFVS